MSKIFKNSVNKVTLISIVMGVILALSIVITAVFGFNYATSVNDSKTLTVSMNLYLYDNKLEDVKTACENEFKKQSLKVEYVYEGVMSGDECELVFVFDKDANLKNAVTNLEKTFETNTAANGKWEGSFLTVTSASETVETKIPTSYFVRAAVAAFVVAVLAFVYVLLRFGMNEAIVEGVSTFAGALLAAAIVLLVRIPVTSSFFYVVSLAALLTATLTLLSLNKVRANAKEGAAETTADAIVNGIAVTETLCVVASLGVSLVLVGAIAVWSVRWVALAMLLGVIASAAVALFFSPALYLPLKSATDEKAAGITKSGYMGAKKTSQKVVKELEAIEVKEEAPVEEETEQAE